EDAHRERWRGGDGFCLYGHRATSLLADDAQLMLQRHGIEPLERQRQEQLDATLERQRGVHERLALLFLAAFDGGRIGHAPMGRHRLARPYGTHLASGVVADGEDE